jgi:hypothetical protein
LFALKLLKLLQVLLVLAFLRLRSSLTYISHTKSKLSFIPIFKFLMKL